MRPLNKLFSPINIGSMTLKNRIVMAPMNSRLGNSDGTSSQKMIDYYEARAKGDVGLIILPSISVDRISPFKNNLVLWHRKFIPSVKEVVQAVQAYGTKIVPQLCHPAIGKAPLSCLSTKEIKSMTEQFGDAAIWAREAGCDGVELHAAHARLLLGSFISALCNRRTDSYGGSIEGRLKLLLEVVGHVREKVEQDFPIMVRISGDELVPGGRNVRETQYIAPFLIEAGVDALDMSIGVFGHPLMGGVGGIGSPEGITVPLAKAVKEVVDVPVVAVGRINSPGYAENVLSRNEADLIALGRALIADPEWPKKAAEERFDDIAPCIGCGLGCGRREGDLTCLINPMVGKEAEMEVSKAKKSKKVMVIGGGPAGLEAARISALRGHQVTLYEKESVLGGQLNLAAVPPTKQELTKIIQYLSTQVEKLEIPIRLNTEVNPQLVKDIKPDVVIVATGSEPYIPDIPGLKNERIITAYDVLAGKALPGSRNVLIIGGGMVGCEVADFLSDQSYKLPGSRTSVTIVEMMQDICPDIAGENRISLLKRLYDKGVRIITSAKVIKLLADGIVFIVDGKEKTAIGFDAIVLALGGASVNDISTEIDDYISEVYVIGDATKPRRALEAIAEGAEVGRRI